ncbi:hypothetical protein ACLMJK_009108 [Lecanora helva]
MFQQKQTYQPVSAGEPPAEMANWRQDPELSVEERNNWVSVHRRPGFFKKGLLGSIAVNAVLLVACAWMYMQLKIARSNCK